MLQDLSDETVTVSITGETMCTEDTNLRHPSAPETRKALQREIDSGVGATEAFENVQEDHLDYNFTKNAARTHVARHRRRQITPETWPRDVMLCLVLLRETQKEEICPEKKPVSGYIQVCNVCSCLVENVKSRRLYVIIIFQDIGLSPPRLILHSADQLELYSKLAKSGSLILHLDATAGLIRRAEYLKRQLYLLSAVVDSPMTELPPISISDCVTEESRVEDVEFWLRKLRCDVSRLQNVHFADESSTPAVVVTDFSWALIHAALAVFADANIIQYLNTMFQRSMGCPQTAASPCIIFSCSSHFIARSARNLSKLVSCIETRELLLRSMAALISASNLKEAGRVWGLMVSVFGTPNITPQWETNVSKLNEVFGKIPMPITDEVDEDNDNKFRDDVRSDTIRGRSPYASYFEKPPTTEDEAGNVLYVPKALQYIYRLWLPLYGLWGQPALAGLPNITKYLTNAKVESWFG